jgi:hypothetical protein
MRIDFLKIVANDNYNNFQHLTFIFSQKIISLFWKLFTDELNIRVRYYNVHVYIKYIYIRLMQNTQNKKNYKKLNIEKINYTIWIFFFAYFIFISNLYKCSHDLFETLL